jgi:hypothetical protein
VPPDLFRAGAFLVIPNPGIPACAARTRQAAPEWPPRAIAGRAGAIIR